MTFASTPSRLLRCLTVILTVSLAEGSGWPSTASARSDAIAAAREHFDKGLAAYRERRFSDAVEEFESAYKISRAFKILFNIGQVNVALGRPVEGVDAYDRYLKQGGATISAERRKEVQIEIEHQLARIGTLVIRTSPEGADVRIDGALAGKSPLPRAIRVEMGRHTVQAILAGHAANVREVDVHGRADVVVELALEAFVMPKAEAPPAPPPPAPPVPVMPVVIMSPAPPPHSAAPWGDGRLSEARTPSSRTHNSDRAGVSTNWQRIIGCAVLVGGLATATAGGVVAYKGQNQADDALERLNAATDAHDSATYDLAKPDYDAAIARNRLGWTVAGVGVAGIVGGIILIATAPERTSNFAFTSWTTGNSGGLSLRGAW